MKKPDALIRDTKFQPAGNRGSGALRDRRKDCGPKGPHGKTGRARALDFGRSTRLFPSEVSELPGRRKKRSRKDYKPEVDDDPGTAPGLAGRVSDVRPMTLGPPLHSRVQL